MKQPKLTGPVGYLGRFRKAKILRAGHNTYDEDEKKGFSEVPPKIVRPRDVIDEEGKLGLRRKFNVGKNSTVELDGRVSVRRGEVKAKRLGIMFKHEF